MIKKLSLTVLLAVATVMLTSAQANLTAYVTDDDPNGVNVRSTPGGAVAMCLPDTASYMLVLSSVSNGWWKVENIEVAETGESLELKASSTGLWIHNSVIGFSTRNYGGQRWCLRSRPSEKSRATYWFRQEIMLHPLQVKGDWIKVVTNDGHQGWIESVNICDNPLTNCC